jgi:pantoate--beta-alanine ligase
MVPGPLLGLQQQCLHCLIEEGLRPDYFAFADAGDLEPVNHWDGTRPLVALAAAFMGEVRLIDNLLLDN